MPKHKGPAKSKGGTPGDLSEVPSAEAEGTVLRHTCTAELGFGAFYDGQREVQALVRHLERISSLAGQGVSTVFGDMLVVTRTVYAAHVDLLALMVAEAQHGEEAIRLRLQAVAAAAPAVKLPPGEEGHYRMFIAAYREALDRAAGEDGTALRYLEQRYQGGHHYDEVLAEFGLAFHDLVNASTCFCGQRTFSDVVGNVYMQYVVSHLGQKGSGQFFTPQNVAFMMALMSGGQDIEPEAWERLRDGCRAAYAERPERLAYALRLIDDLIPRPELQRLETGLKTYPPAEVPAELVEPEAFDVTESDFGTHANPAEASALPQENPAEVAGSQADEGDSAEGEPHGVDPFIRALINLMTSHKRIARHQEVMHKITTEIIPEVSGHIKPITMIDPTCGSGVMLLAWAAATPEYLTVWRCLEFWGCDLDSMCVSMAKTNCVLYGLDGRTPYLWVSEEPAAVDALSVPAGLLAPAPVAATAPALPAAQAAAVREILAPVLDAADEAARVQALADLRAARREAEQQFVSQQMQLIADDPAEGSAPLAPSPRPRARRTRELERGSGQQLLPFFMVPDKEEVEVG